jgi:1-acyl-sn-glycerol-3-phosphate acyltransferase
MAWEIRLGLSKGKRAIRNLSVILWTVFSGLVYGGTAFLAGIFSRHLGQRVARLWAGHLLFVAGVKLTVKGMSAIDRKASYVFVANHQSHFDIPVLFAGIGMALSFIAKKELFSIPIFGWGMASIGCIGIDRKNSRNARASITRAINLLKKDNLSLVLFPEGTRSTSGEVGEFKRGSFTLALEAGVPVVPVAICGTGEIHRKASHEIRPGAVTITIGKPIPTEEIQKLSKEELSAAMRNSIVSEVEKNR